MRVISDERTVLPLRSTYLDHAFREVCQLRDMDTEALVADPRLDFVEQSDVAIPTVFVRLRHMGDHMEVLHMFDLLVKRGELMEMRRKHAERMDLGCNVPARSIVKTRIRKAIVRHTLR